MITYAELRRQLFYDPETGVFTRIAQTAHKNCKLGKTLGWKIRNGYLMISLGGHKYYAHRLAWFYMHGEWPNPEVDHINRNKTDNRIANLREVTRGENTINRPPNRSNISGVIGVSWYARDSRWQASICRNGKMKHLGYFDTVEEAAQVRKQAEEML